MLQEGQRLSEQLRGAVERSLRSGHDPQEVQGGSGPPEMIDLLADGQILRGEGSCSLVLALRERELRRTVEDLRASNRAQASAARPLSGTYQPPFLLRAMAVIEPEQGQGRGESNEVVRVVR